MIFFTDDATLASMSQASEIGERTLALKCRECRRENVFAYEYLWKSGGCQLHCPHCGHSDDACYWEKDRKRALMFASQHYLADRDREWKEIDRQARLTRQLHGPVRSKLRFEILKRDEFRCRYCGRCAPNVELHIDHVIPRAKGGLTKAENLITACSECNLGKGSA